MAIFVGTLIMVFGVFLLWRQWRFAQASTSSFGTVIDYKVHDSRDVEDQEDDGKGSYTYAPIVSYTAPDGSRRTFTERMSLYKKRYAIGTVVRIRYDQRDDEASLDSFMSLYLGSLLVVIMGLVIVVAALLPSSPALD